MPRIAIRLHRGVKVRLDAAARGWLAPTDAIIAEIAPLAWALGRAVTTTFDATITLTPWALAGTPLLARPQDAVRAVRGAVEAMSGAAWIDVEWQNIRGEWPLVDRMVVRADEGEGHAEALKGVVEMVAKRAIEMRRC